MHIISDYHLSILHTLTGIQLGDELPDVIIDAYWELKRCFDRISAPVTERELAVLAWQQGLGKPIKEEGQDNLAMKFRGREVQTGHPIEIMFRKEWKPGKLVSTVPGDKRKLLVTLDEDGVERTVDLLLAREVELAGV